MTNGPLIFAALTTLLVMMIFVALMRLAGGRDPVEERLAQYGIKDDFIMGMSAGEGEGRRSRVFSWLRQLMSGFGLGTKLARELAHADLPLTAAEFILIPLGAAIVGFLIGTLRLGVILGLVIGAIFALVPLFYVRFLKKRRQRAITEQLPEVLTLLIGALRAGVGLSQALEMLVKQLPPPASSEFAGASRAINLGLSVPQALSEMAERVGSDDMALVVTAINVQYEMGGNLAQTLEIIDETVRDRIRIVREIRVLTTQQRLTGYILGGLPIVLGIGFFLISPQYMSRLFEPGWVRLLPLTAAVLQIIGFVVIRRILDIEV